MGTLWRMGTEPHIGEESDGSTSVIEAESMDSGATAPPSSHRASSDRAWPIAIALMGALVIGLVLATQVFLLSSLNDTKAEITSLQSQLGDVDDSVAALSDDVADVAESVEDTSTAPPLASGGSSNVQPPAASLPAGFLPRFDRNTADSALGLELGQIEGIDGYTEQLVNVDPADGTRRIWMVWAHWCPFCQQEMPLLSDWYPTIEDRYNTELVTVSTNIDPSRGNPLNEYLVAEQFPFQVVVDAESDLAVKMGVSAFPFWVITDGNGEVLLRTTGLLQIEQIENLFEQVENFGA